MLVLKQRFTIRLAGQKGKLGKAQQIREFLRTSILFFCTVAATILGGCGQSENPTVPASANQVYSYFGVPFVNRLTPSVSTFDHSQNQITVSSIINNQTTQTPSPVLRGSFSAAPTGFLSVTENFAITGSSFFITPQNPPLNGAWALEIPEAGVIGNFLKVNSTGAALPVSAAPAAMAENSTCPDTSPVAIPFLYVTVPNANNTFDTADYGGVNITTAGSAVTFATQPYLIGPVSQSPTTVTGGCSQTIFGPVTAYPLNSFGTPSNVELIAMNSAGLLVSSFVSNSSATSLGAFGGGTGVIGVSPPSSPVDVSAVIGAKYNGFTYSPQNGASTTYDLTVLASAFGDNTALSPSCSMLQSSLVANNGQGAKTVASLPSANSLYGGEFLRTTSNGPVNDPTGASGSENCDVVIDLGMQDSANNGLFPNATLFIGSNFPPFSASKAWTCVGTNLACAVSFPAAAVVGQVQGNFVILVVASAASTPAAQLPNNFGSPIAQPLGIYLFQKSQ